MASKLDRNGYSKSIMATTAGECYLCGYVGETARHEVFYGTGTRALSKRYGLWVNLCPRCHAEVHAHPESDKADTLDTDAREAFIAQGHSLAEFRKIFVTGNVKHWEL